MNQRVVVDASAILSFILNEALAPLVIESVDENTVLVAPDVLYHEIPSALVNTLLYGEGLTTAQATEAITYFEEDIAVQYTSENPVDVLALSMKHRVQAYDAQYVLAAKRLRTPLLSLDKNQRRAAQSEGLRVRPASLKPRSDPDDTAS